MEDLNDKITGETLEAQEFVQPMSEIQNVIEQLGQALTSSDLNQLGKGIAGYVANSNFYTDSGIADAYVLSKIGLKQTATSYTDGFKASFIAGNTNTGASTANIAGLGIKNIKISNGLDPVPGDISGWVNLRFDSANDWLELINPFSATPPFQFETLQQAVDNTSIYENATIILKERTAGNGGGATWDAVLSSGVTNNGFSIVQCVGVPTLSLVLRLGGILNIKKLGATGDGSTDDFLPIQFALDNAIILKLPVYIPSGIYRTTEQLTITENPAPGGAYGVLIKGDNTTWANVSVIHGEHTDPSILSLKNSNGSVILGIKLESDPVTFPKTALILGRDSNGDSCGWHNISRLWIDGKYSVAGIYSIASEENIWKDIFIQIQGGGAKYGFYSSTGDVLLVDSLPSNSNIANSVSRMHIWNWQAISDSACIYLETSQAMGSWSFNECYCIPKSGNYYEISCGVLDGLAPLGPFSFIGCGGEIYAPIGPFLDTPDNTFKLSSVANIDLPGITILGGRAQLINAASTRKIFNADANIALIKPNIVIPALEDPATSFTVFRAKIEAGIFDVADSSAWVPLVFSGAWQDTFGAPFAAASFQVDSVGTLRLRGTVDNAAAGPSIIAVLPAGFEPQYNAFFATQDNGVNATVFVETNGNISITVGTGTNVDLSQVSFKLRDA